MIRYIFQIQSGIKALMIIGLAAFNGARAESSFYLATEESSKMEQLTEIQNQQEELEKVYNMAQKRLAEEKKELFILKFLNQNYCKRLQLLRTDCSPLVRLIPDPSEKVLGCFGNSDTEVANAFKWQVSVSGLGGTAQLQVKSKGLTYNSTRFSDGTHEVQWSHDAGNDMTGLAPRFIEVDDFRIYVSGNKNITFSLLVNGHPVFQGYTLAHRLQDAGQYLNVDLSALSALQQSNSCKIPRSELDALTDQSKKEADVEYKATLPDEGPDLSMSDAKAEYIAKKLFASVFGRLPKLASGEGFDESPLLEVLPYIKEEKYEQATLTLLSSNLANKLLSDELEPVSGYPAAEKVAYKIYVGFLGSVPNDFNLQKMANRVLHGERGKVVEEVILSEEFQKDLHIVTSE